IKKTMNHKQMPRLGSAIASTILSLFSAVSLVGVDKAQAAKFSYTFDADGYASGSFKVDNSSLTGIEVESIAVSEGRLYTGLTLAPYKRQPKEYYDLAGATAYFYQGDFRGLRAFGSDELTPEDNIIEDEGVTYYTDNSGGLSWSLDTDGITSDDRWTSYFWGYQAVYLGSCCVARGIVYDTPVSYTLVNTEPEPVPEPLTAGGTALALAGLSWLKHKKKMAA
ncbi:PEP-CTERM sorting domain-containing protein, partial [Microcoleus sp. herbarium2]|uniref:PEP-CTERM sorting domain-containing protein n=1 Tax=Microcoleus sp. herbarium2 TaxID=3055433 RepID=UPI002FD112FC